MTKNKDKDKSPIQNLYSIRDLVARTFLPPYPSQSDDVAKRQFSNLCRNPESTIAQNPQDFDLYCLGDFDPDTGQIDSLPTPVVVAHAVDYIQSASNEQIAQQSLQFSQANQK